MSQPFLGQVVPVAFGFAPVGWLPCDGRLIAIDAYSALFNLLGTTFGGDGAQTFGLPNLSGAVAVGAGQGPSLQPYLPGQTGGSEAVTLTANQLGSHGHTMQASSTAGTLNTPGPAAVLASSQAAVPVYGSATPAVPMAAAALAANGGSQPHENRQPYLAVNYIIAVEGIYPSQG